MNAEQLIKLIVDLILDTARDAMPLGAPSGVVYAALSSYGLSLTVYNQILATMQQEGVIVVENNCIKVPS